MRCAVSLLALLLALIVGSPTSAGTLGCLAHKAKRLITLPIRAAGSLLRAVEIGYIMAWDNKAYWLIPYLVERHSDDKEHCPIRVVVFLPSGYLDYLQRK